MTGFPKTLTDFSQANPLFSLKGKWEDFFKSQARLYLENQDFFSKKTEGWKHFPFQRLKNQNFIFDLSAFPETRKSPPDKRGNESDPLPLSDRAGKTSRLLDSFLISVENGRPVIPPETSKNFSVFSWREFLLGRAPLDSGLKEKIIRTLKKQRNPFCALNNALSGDGLIIVIQDPLEKPLEIHYRQNSQHDKQGLNLRNFIFLADNSSAQILELFYGRNEEKPLFFNIQTDCFIGEKARLEHSRIDQAGQEDILINQLFTKLCREAQSCFFSLSLSAGTGRWQCSVVQRENSSSQVRGLSLLEGNKIADHKVEVLHQKRGAKSGQLYKSFLFDSARQAFQGLTSVDQGAQKSEASQLSKNFLFGQKALAGVFPELNIQADDVKASHGATVSSFAENRELIFYLQSRGIDPVSAFHLIFSGLIRSVCSCLQDNTKQTVEAFIQKKLKLVEPSLPSVF